MTCLSKYLSNRSIDSIVMNIIHTIEERKKEMRSEGQRNERFIERFFFLIRENGE